MDCHIVIKMNECYITNMYKSVYINEPEIYISTWIDLKDNVE